MSEPAEALDRLAGMREAMWDWWSNMVETLRQRLDQLDAEAEPHWQTYYERLVELAERKAEVRHLFLPSDLVEHVVAGYKRVLFERAYADRFELPVRTKEEWDRLPDRWFDEPAST